MGSQSIEYSHQAARITLDKVSSWEDLNAATLEEGNRKFNAKTLELWNEFAVSGVLQFDKKEGKQVLRPYTDLDGNATLGILKMSGINTENLTFVKPGESIRGVICLDTGDRFGVVYDPESYTAWIDHHEKGRDEVTSTAQIMYETVTSLGLLEKTPALDKAVDFVTKIDNRKYPAEQFLRSGKTILGLHRGFPFDKLVTYFESHDSPQEELTPEELEKYGLNEAAEQQQKIVDEAMLTLTKMEQEGKVADTRYGSVVINVNHELRVGASGAYVRHDGILNITPGKSFAVTLKERLLDESKLKEILGDKFQGKIIRNEMWIYDDEAPLNLSQEEILSALG
jgi:hypothetical protein